MTLSILALGLLANIMSMVLYLRGMVKGDARPSRVTNFAWALEGGIALAASWSDGVRWGLLPVMVAFVGPFSVLCLSYSLKQAAWKTSPFDFVCGVLAVIGLILWKVTGNPNLAILFSIFAGTTAAFPTIIKSWRHPDTEIAAGYLLPVIGYATSFVALERYSFSEIAYPAYCVAICALIAGLIIVGRCRHRRLGTDADQPHRIKYKPLER
ncbi:MAG: hypothetical protein WC612_05950 [Bdellovibrionales bacterium]|jgi:hypothetical protein